MTLQYSTAVRNAKLDAVETAIGASAILRIRTGAPPVNCAAADAGTLLAELALPADWMANAVGGSKSLAGTWQDISADASGTAAHFRIYESTGVTCHAQGTVTATGLGGDMTFNTDIFVILGLVQVTSFTLTAGNA